VASSEEEVDPQTPLSGTRVVDFTQAVYGAGAAQILGDLGADVVKIEPPWGEFMRWGQSRHRPGEHGERLSDDVPEAATWLAMNRNKRSLAIDLHDERGLEIIRRLIAQADIVIHNYRADVMDRMNLGYEDVKAINEKIVYVRKQRSHATMGWWRHVGASNWGIGIGAGRARQSSMYGERPIRGPEWRAYRSAERSGGVDESISHWRKPVRDDQPFGCCLEYAIEPNG
jgi:hypothetical protein